MKKLILSLILLNISISAEGGEKKKIYKKTQEVSFDSTDVDGLVRSPDGAYVNPKKGVKFQPLYKVEKTFDKEIKNSVDYLE